jgi:AbrB family looped-hinge helix DNA binding protein
MVVTMSSKGQLVIPAEVRTALGILPGTRILVTVENKHIVLQPVTEQLVEETKGILAGGPSLSDELQRERRSDNKW